jgi:hypothetical protein
MERKISRIGRWVLWEERNERLEFAMGTFSLPVPSRRVGHMNFLSLFLWTDPQCPLVTPPLLPSPPRLVLLRLPCPTLAEKGDT